MIETLDLTDVTDTKARLRIARVTCEGFFLGLVYRTEEQANLSERTCSYVASTIFAYNYDEKSIADNEAKE